MALLFVPRPFDPFDHAFEFAQGFGLRPQTKQVQALRWCLGSEVVTTRGIISACVSRSTQASQDLRACEPLYKLSERRDSGKSFRAGR